MSPLPLPREGIETCSSAVRNSSSIVVSFTTSPRGDWNLLVSIVAKVYMYFSLLYHFPERGLKLFCLRSIISASKVSFTTSPRGDWNFLIVFACWFGIFVSFTTSPRGDWNTWSDAERGLPSWIVSFTTSPRGDWNLDCQKWNRCLYHRKSPLPLPREGIETFC